MANDIQIALSDAIETIVQKKLKEAGYDVTLTCYIEKIKDKDNNIYSVKNNTGDSFIAYADKGEIYTIGEQVYVLVPQNDMGKNKTIVGRVRSKTSSIKIDPNNNYYLTGALINDLYNINTSDKNEFNVNNNEEINFYYSDIQNSNDEKFALVSENQTYLYISGVFQTLINNNINSLKSTDGNYGIKLKFLAESGTERIFILDRSLMPGNPNKYSNPTKVIGIFPIGDDKLIKLLSVDFFSTGYELIVEGDNNDIKLTDFIISYASKTQDKGYSAYISIPGGNYAYDDINPWIFKLKPVVSNNGSILYNINPTVYWYKLENAKWIKIENNIENNELNYELDSSISQQPIKLEVIFGGYILTDEIVLYSKSGLSIVRNLNVLEIVGQQKNIEYTYQWYYKNNDDIIIIDNANNFNYDTSVDSFSNTRTYYCKVGIEGVYTTLTYIFEKSEEVAIEDLSVIISTDAPGDVFYYDENGNYKRKTPIENPKLDFNIIADYNWQKVKGKIKSAEWIFPFGDTMIIGNSSAIIEENKIKGVFSIKERFNFNASNNNTIKLKITTNINQEYYFSKNLSFVKEGNPGTNGTGLSMRIIDINYDINTGAQVVVKIYEDGQTLLANSLIVSKPALEEGIINLVNTVPSNEIEANGNNEYKITGIILNTPAEESNNFTSLIEIKATITGSTDNSKIYILSCLVPIPYSINNYKYEDIKNIPNYIVYNELGENPQYDSDIETYVYGFGEWYTTSINGKLIPNYNYSSSKSYGGIKFIKNSQIIYCPIVFIKNTYSRKLINSWDGESLVVDNFNSQILASQIGAGYKNDQNQFTGVIMGMYQKIDNIDSKYAGKTGIFGFSDGTITYALTDDGNAYFENNIEVSGGNFNNISASGGNFNGIKVYGESYLNKVQANEIQITNSEGWSTTVLGTIGLIGGSTGSALTSNIGIQSNSGYGIILEAATNMRLTAVNQLILNSVDTIFNGPIKANGKVNMTGQEIAFNDATIDFNNAIINNLEVEAVFG